MTALAQQESLMVPVKGEQQLHIRRIFKDKRQLGSPVLMLHGDVEDGRIFYSSARSGLANYLAEQGYDVFVVDGRGKGKSWPAIGERSDFGYHEVITIDIPAYVKAIVKKRGPIPQIWIGHGSGGLLLAAYLIRFGEEHAPVSRMAYFGTRRRADIVGWKKQLLLDLIWQRLGRRLVQFYGYLPARGMRLGTMDEAANCHRDSIQWLHSDEWIDPEDGFDYGEAAKLRYMPPSLYFACVEDQAFADPKDVRAFMLELGPHDGRLVSLSQSVGNLYDYGYLDMLMHADARLDHFPQLLAWLEDSSINWLAKEAG